MIEKKYIEATIAKINFGIFGFICFAGWKKVEKNKEKHGLLNRVIIIDHMGVSIQKKIKQVLNLFLGVSIILFVSGFAFGQRLIQSDNEYKDLIFSVTSEINSQKISDFLFKENTQIDMAISAKNIGSEDLEFYVTDPTEQYKTELYRNGELVNYTKEVIELLKPKDKNAPPARSRVFAIKIEPEKNQRLETLPINFLYGDLITGDYSLNVYYRPTENHEFKYLCNTFFKIEKKQINLLIQAKNGV